MAVLSKETSKKETCVFHLADRAGASNGSLGQGDRSAPHLSPHLHIDSGHQYNIFDISKIFNVQLYMALMSV